MFLQCTQCLSTFDSPSAQAPCPRCGAPVGSSMQGSSSAAGAMPQTMAMDAGMVAQMLQRSSSGAPSSSFGAPPSSAPAPFANPAPTPHSLPPTGGFHAPPSAVSAPPSPYGAGGFGPTPMAPYGAPMQPYPGAAGNAQELVTSAVISLVLAVVSFLGACNLVGIAAVVMSGLAWSEASSRPNAETPGKVRTARIVSIVALALTVLTWVGLALFYFFVGDVARD